MNLEHDLPVVSVAIITYQQKELLRVCIDSVLDQTYPRVEICVADDGSTDGTQEMLKQYALENEGRFRLALAPENRGITPNSNAAQDLCTGKYIAWLGGDDIFLPEKLSKQVAYMEAHPECRICYHNAEVFDHETNKRIRLFNGDKPPSQKPRTGGVEQYLTRSRAFNTGSATMVRSEFVKPFDERIKIPSDYLYWMEILADGGRVCYLDEILIRHRRHTQNITVTTSILQRYRDRINILKTIWRKYPRLRWRYGHLIALNLAKYKAKLVFRKYIPGLAR